MHRRTLLLGVLVVLALPAPAGASDWLPHPADATWTYSWTDTAYQTTPTKEKVTVKETKGAAFTLAWTTQDLDPPNPDDASVSIGTVAFQDNGGDQTA